MEILGKQVYEIFELVISTLLILIGITGVFMTANTDNLQAKATATELKYVSSMISDNNIEVEAKYEDSEILIGENTVRVKYKDSDEISEEHFGEEVKSEKSDEDIILIKS